ncbi:MAG: hypothetical protein FJ279_17160 [Planctomycetes bacterium]|nr:hypothetical protein [Planctomycetota bacterium]MBM4080617.1 hypothetical protein [Planctomycetota bacterium]MBM4087634.1 hypothetical protein [Planctomycetota bacterium]
MNSQLTEDFVACFQRLPDAVKAKARRSYRLWKKDMHHPGLHFKRVHRKEPMYSVRVGKGWRALGLVEGDTISWFWIGSHADYEKLLSQL